MQALQHTAPGGKGPRMLGEASPAPTLPSQGFQTCFGHGRAYQGRFTTVRSIWYYFRCRAVTMQGDHLFGDQGIPNI